MVRFGIGDVGIGYGKMIFKFQFGRILIIKQ